MSDDTKFTPGPWDFEPEDVSESGHYEPPMVFSVADEDNPQVVCEVSVRANLKSNGYLIAAAPDLYEALDSALAFVAGFSGIYQLNHQLQDFHPTHAQILKQVMDALAKARGGK